MLIIGLALLIFGIACALHVIVWRRAARTPSGGTLIALLVAAVLGQCLLAGFFLCSWPSLLLVTALALQFAACYAISYPAMQAHSPSLEIARHLAAAGGDGIAPAALYARLSEPSLVAERIEDLLRDGFAVERANRLQCTLRGALLARVFGAWKALLREQKGG